MYRLVSENLGGREGYVCYCMRGSAEDDSKLTYSN